MRLATMADRQRIEEICNDPLIRVWTACDGAPPCDAEKYLVPPSYTLMDERGCFLGLNIGPGSYVFHTNLLPTCRGFDSAPKAAAEALRVAFLQTDTQELLTMVPGNMPHVKMMARLMGFKHQFDRQALWPANGVKHDMGFYRLSLDEWILSGACQATGEAFHERLHHELNLPGHAQNKAHDAYVGAVAEMILVGNVSKAVETYNRWARFAMYKTIRVISESPLLIDIQQCVLKVEGAQFSLEAHHA